MWRELTYHRRRPLPARLWQALEHNRTAIPHPSTYALAGTVGLGLGLVLSWLIQRSWWWLALPPGGVVAAWVAAAATAFARPQRTSTFESLHDQIDVKGARARREQRMAARIAACPFPVHDLSQSTVGPPRIGSTSWSTDDGLSSLAIVRGPYDKSP